MRALSAGSRAGCWLALVVGAGCAVYLTLRGSSNLRTVSWIPYPIALWADYHGRTRNLVAYALLGVPVLVRFREHKKQLQWLLALGILGTLLEYGQLWIPSRWFEWQDIALSLAGLAAAWIIGEGIRLALRKIRRRNASSGATRIYHRRQIKSNGGDGRPASR
jgi:hypothetical protein